MKKFKLCILFCVVLLSFALILPSGVLAFADGDVAGENKFYSSYAESVQCYDNTLLGNAGGVPIYADDGLQRRANCYGYAMRFMFGVENFGPENVLLSYNYNDVIYDYSVYKQQPGEFIDKTNGYLVFSDNEVANLYNRRDLNVLLENVFPSSPDEERYTLLEKSSIIKQLVQGDAYTLGYTVTEYAAVSDIPDATQYDDRRLIALVVSDVDYHFYMQHTDNTWSHKPGYSPVSNCCISHNTPLTNENIKQHAREGIYSNSILMFFYVTKDAIIDYSHIRGTFGLDSSDANTSTRTYPRFTDYAGSYEFSALDIGTAPQTYTDGHINYVGDVDYYKITPSVSGAYTFTVGANPLVTRFPITVSVFYNGLEVRTVTSTTEDAEFHLMMTAGRDYYIRVTAPDVDIHGDLYQYTLKIVKYGTSN